jgi:hypothetical protein
MSYSRKDYQFAVWLREVLLAEGNEVFRDLDDTIGGEVWWERLKSLIVASDAVVCVLTPNFVASKVCADEINYAITLKRRIIPLILEPVNWDNLPEALRRLHALSFQSELSRIDQVRHLQAALFSDIDWIREHTRIGELAHHWHIEGRQTAHLLRGSALTKVESWFLARPSSVDVLPILHKEYIEASKSQEQLRIEYERQKFGALRSYSEPILKNRLAKLYEQAEVEHQKTTGTIMKISSSTQNVKAEINAIENFLAFDGKWHSAPAELHKNLGAIGDYSEVYRFPCCGTLVTMGDGPPGQYRADGCIGKPE